MDNLLPQSASGGGSAGLLPPRRRNGLPVEESERRRGDAELLDRVRIQHQLQLSANGAATEPPASTPLSGASEGCATGKGPLPCLEYQVLASRLVGSAVPLLKKLLRTGSIKKQLLTRRLPNNLTSDDYERLHTSKAARDELALIIVANGEEYFRLTVIPQGKWDADGGASLETYFVNGCLFKFADSVRAWKKDHPEWAGTMPADDRQDRSEVEEIADLRSGDMIKAIEDRDIIRRLSATAPPPVKLIMQLMLEDLTFAEIGERLDLSARAVEGRLHRFRTQVKKDIRTGRFDLPLGLVSRDAA
jgi:DNA-directed RNA polymerase specialized sigma24 family protein